jgi:endonuclease YncB( thermonuclease family)
VALFPAAHELEARPAHYQVPGVVVRILDGDTVDLLIGRGRIERIRLEGIDAPEKGQPFGTQARKRLAGFCFQREVVVRVSKKDRYRRSIGRVFADGEDLNQRMLREGMAWHYARFAHEQPAGEHAADAQTEREARAARLGVWSDAAPIPPWDWRKSGRGARP